MDMASAINSCSSRPTKGIAELPEKELVGLYMLGALDYLKSPMRIVIDENKDIIEKLGRIKSAGITLLAPENLDSSLAAVGWRESGPASFALDRTQLVDFKSEHERSNERARAIEKRKIVKGEPAAERRLSCQSSGAHC